MRKLLALLALLVPFSGLMAQATYTTTINHVIYQMRAGSSSCSVIGNNGASGDVVIPATVEYEGNTWQVGSIEAEAFQNGQLTSIAIPDGVRYIGKRAFNECFNLKAVTVSGSGGWGSIEVEEEAFNYCRKLTAIGFADKLTGIGKSAFNFCGFTTLTLPKVNFIRESAFSSCQSLASITLSPSLTRIADYAFNGCTSLTNVYIPAASMPTTAGTAFQGCNLSRATLQVPSSCIADYKATAPWSGFGTKVETNTLTYRLNDEVYKTVAVRADAAITPETAPTVPAGYTFSGWEGLTATMPHADLTVTGAFVPNNYHIYYLLDDEFWQMQTVACGAWISAPTPPAKEGFAFAGWTGLPADYKMPAGDLTVQGTYQQQCATPFATYDAGEGKLRLDCATEGATLKTNVQCWDIQPYATTSKEIRLNRSYSFYVTASKEGFASSTSYISLTWPDADVTATGDITLETSGSEAKAAPLLVQSADGQLLVSGADEGTAIQVYDADGKTISQTRAAHGGTTRIALPTPLSAAREVHVGQHIIKLQK